MADKPINHGEGKGVAALAAAQHGVVSAAQLYAVGLTRDQVAGRVRAGWLHRIHRGVYGVGHSLSPQGLWMAATLAAGRDAVLSHVSAAALWRLLDPRKTGWGRRQGRYRGEPPVHVTRPGQGGMQKRPGLILHRSRTLGAGELTLHRGIPVTTPGRTLLDVATMLRGRPLERAVDEAERLRLLSPEDLVAILADHRGEPGAGALGSVVNSRIAGSGRTRSDLEKLFLRLCDRHRLPQPRVNAPLHGLTVDFLWEAQKLVVEVDGRGSHDTGRGFQDDRDRDSLLAVHGYLTLRFTWFDVTRRPGVVAHRVRKLLWDRAS